MSFFKSMHESVCHLMLANTGGDWRGMGWLNQVSLQPLVTEESFPNGSSQSSCKLPFPQPRINNMSTIKKFKCISNHLIINCIQLVYRVLCTAVWSPWRHHQYYSGDLMSSGCVLSANLAACLCSFSGLRS